MALVAQYELDLDQLDVKIAFLYGDLDEEIYMSMGFKIAGKENIICKLKKLLYGLKQPHRQWYKRFDYFIRGKMYTCSHYDPCVYYNKLPIGEYIYLPLYVDDMLIASKIRSAIDDLKIGVPPDTDYPRISASKSASNPDMDIIFSHPSIFISVSVSERYVRIQI